MSSIFCFLSIILLASKTILFVLLITTNFVILIYILQHKNKKKFVLLLFLNVLLIIVIAKIPFIQQRFQDIIDSNYEVIHRKKHNHNLIYTGITIRLIKWKLILEILEEKQSWLLGVSIGDAMPSLIEKSKQINLHPGNSTMPIINIFNIY